MIRDFLSELVDYVSGNCQIPGIEVKVLYGDAWETKASTALIRSKKLIITFSVEIYKSPALKWLQAYFVTNNHDT